MTPGTLLDDRFELGPATGTGGMATVYRARDRRTGATVAVKMLYQDAGNEHDREARILAKLDHPAIVRYVAHGHVGERSYIVMEWLEGTDLAALLRRGPLAPDAALGVALQIASALGHAHARGIVHRDVKPGNVFFVDGDLSRAKLLDFGIARDAAEPASALDRAGMVVGTPGYMAPEQIALNESDARADVFSLGCVLYRAIGGVAPFASTGHALGALARSLLDDVTPLRELVEDLPRGLDDLVLRMLAKAKELRPSDGAAITAALSSIQRRSLEPPLPAALTGREKRNVSVILLGGDLAGEGDATSFTIVTRATPSSEAPTLEALAARFGASLVVLPHGALVATIAYERAATDQAVRAARFALALARLRPGLPIALATGRSEIVGNTPVGVAIERATELLAKAGPGVAIDAVTASLVENAFDVAPGEPRMLGAERVISKVRTFMGKDTPCVGRERELAFLRDRFDEVVHSSRARVALVTAPAGGGKSRLRYELIRGLPPGTAVWIARGDPLARDAPLAMLSSALRRAAGILDGEPSALAMEKLEQWVGTTERGARNAVLLGELLGVAPLGAAGPVRAQADALALGDQMRQAVIDVIGATCAERPLVLVLEDLHHGDRASVRFVDAALRDLADAPLFVLALARPDVTDVFPTLFHQRGLDALRLPPITKADGEVLARHVLGDAASPRVVAEIATRSAGNPFYLEELIRSVAEGRGDAFPETVVAMVEARFEALTALQRRILRAASIFGEAFFRGGVETLLANELAIDESLDVLTEAELVARRPKSRLPDQTEYVFRHALVCETANAMLTEDDRKLGHTLAAEWLEAAGETSARVLAEHYERGLRPAGAQVHHRRAAVEALYGNDLARAILHATKAAELTRDPESLVELWLIEAEARRFRAEWPLASALAERALTTAPRRSPAYFRAAEELAISGSRVLEPAAMERLRKALLEDLDAGVTAPAVIAAARSAQQQLIAGNARAAEELLAHLAPSFSAFEDHPRARGVYFQAQASSALHRGAVVRFLDIAAQAMNAFAEAGDQRAMNGTRINIGFALTQLGDYERAEPLLVEAVATSERLELHAQALASKHNLGPVHAARGRIDLARQVETAAVDAAHAQGDEAFEAAARAYLARIESAAGNHALAEAEAAAAVELARHAAPTRAYALAALAEAQLALAKNAEALAAAEAATAIQKEIGALEEGQALVGAVHARALLAKGDATRARTRASEAYAIVVSEAAKITDEPARARFLAMREHATLAELAKPRLKRSEV